MTGIETIIAEINAQGELEAKKITGAAQAQVRTMLEEAQKKAEHLAEAERAAAAVREKDMATAGESAAALAKRRALLETRQALIGETIEAAKARLLDLPDEETVALLLQMAARYAQSAKGEMRLSAKDLARLPADFAHRLAQAAPNASLTVSDTPAAIDGGFVLACGDVEQNCSFASLFAAARDAMQDTARQLLFEP